MSKPPVAMAMPTKYSRETMMQTHSQATWRGVIPASSVALELTFNSFVKYSTTLSLAYLQGRTGW